AAEPPCSIPPLPKATRVLAVETAATKNTKPPCGGSYCLVSTIDLQSSIKNSLYKGVVKCRKPGLRHSMHIGTRSMALATATPHNIPDRLRSTRGRETGLPQLPLKIVFVRL